MKTLPIKRAPTLFLKIVLVCIGLLALAVYVFVLPQLLHEGEIGLPEFVHIVRLAVISLYATAIPIYSALYQTFKLLQNIDRNDAFSSNSIQELMYIKYCAVAVSALFVVCMPLAYIVAELDDAPGLILVASAIVVAPLVVATFAAVLQKLVQSALDLKMENDLTV